MSNKRIEECLDRYCTNSAWLNLSENWQVDHLYSKVSDHAPVKI